MKTHNTLLLKIVVLASIFFISSQTKSNAQTYQDYFGLGHTVGVNVSSSSEQVGDEANHSLDGTDLIPDNIGAARFLSQAAFGASEAEIEYLTQIGIEAWLDEQFGMYGVSFLENYQAVYDEVIAKIATVHGTELYDSTRRTDYLSYAFYTKMFTEEDILRQKAAFALSQIFVVAGRGSLKQ